MPIQKTYKEVILLFSMKKFKCPDCEKVFEAETSKDMLNLLLPHYMSEHQDVMKGGTDEKMKDWMEKFHKDWEEAEEIK